MPTIGDLTQLALPAVEESPTVEPEILEPGETPANQLRVVAVPHPFSVERKDFTVVEGATLAEIIERAGIPPDFPVRIFIGDRLVTADREWWPRMRPRPGSIITIRAVPTGGGGRGGKNIGQVILGIILIAVGALMEFPTAGLSTSLILAGAGMVLGGVVNLKIAPTIDRPKPVGAPLQVSQLQGGAK